MPVVVVIPAHNAKDTIDQALGSVAYQTRPPAEVVVSDDTSHDETVKVAAAWVDRLPVRVLTTEENGGPGVARDRAIRGSTSPLIAMLDADDVWFPDHLETLLSLHDAHGGVSAARFLRWAPGQGIASAPSDLAPFPPADRQLQALYQGNFVWIATLFERSLYNAVGGFRPGLRVGEEWDLYIRMLRHGARLHRADHPTVLYRRQAGSLTWDDTGIGDRVRVLALAQEEASDRSERNAIRRGRRRLSAERSLIAAYRLASEGRKQSARREAMKAWRGQRRVAIRAAAMVVAPAFTATRRHRARTSPMVRIRT